MVYVVKAIVSAGVRPIALRYDTVDKALVQARAFLERGVEAVSISDGAGHQINGAELEACCKGEKSLGLDLQVR